MSQPPADINDLPLADPADDGLNHLLSVWLRLLLVTLLCCCAFWMHDPMMFKPLYTEADWSRHLDGISRGPYIFGIVVSFGCLALPMLILAIVAAIKRFFPLFPAIASLLFSPLFFFSEMHLLNVAADAMSSPKEDTPVLWSPEWMQINTDLVFSTTVISTLGGICAFISIAMLGARSVRQAHGS